ncbi:hypothetical protein IWQ56_000022 [Coemansia nantahalensis]|nr:hypothetical protein IWQ56_000022 [Coemansia nantahalensis]
MAQELRWLVEQSIPESISHARECLAATSLLAGTRPAAGAASQVSMAADSAGVSGTATVAKGAVTQLSLTVPAPDATNVTVYLKKNEALPLQQMQSAQCYARAALDRAVEPRQFDSCDDALAHVEHILGDIQSAKQMLAAASQLGAPPLYTWSSEKFAPALPQNMAIECSLDGCELVIRVYWLRPRQGAQGAGLLDALTREQSTGQTLLCDGRAAKVTQAAVLQAPLGRVQEDLATLDRAASVCIDVIGQLHAFDCAL